MAATDTAALDLNPGAATAGTSTPVQSRADTAARATPVPLEDPVSLEATSREPPSKLTVAAAAGVSTAVALSSPASTVTNAHVAPGASTEPVTGNAEAIQRDEATVTHAPPVTGNSTAVQQDVSRHPTPAPPVIAASDDLATVRATDPQAAQHIASYCASTIASANRDALAAECRHREIDAWTRLVLHNEFPTLDDATRRKCNEPPFPDTYVAKERCAKYVLQMNHVTN